VACMDTIISKNALSHFKPVEIIKSLIKLIKLIKLKELNQLGHLPLGQPNQPNQPIAQSTSQRHLSI
jgi:hypothetical protein